MISAKLSNLGPRPDLHHEGLEPQAAGLRIGQSQRVPDLGLVADFEDQGIVRLPDPAALPQTHLVEPDLGAGADPDERARETRRRLRGHRRIDKVDWLGDFAAGRDFDDDAVLHQGGIQGDDGVVGLGPGRGESCDNVGTPFSQRRGKRRHFHACRQPAGKFGREDAIDKQQALRGQADDLLAQRIDALPTRRRDDRQRLAHERTQIRVMPSFDAPMRQARASEGGESIFAHFCDRGGARQPGLGCRERLGKRRFGAGAGRNDLSRHRMPHTSSSDSPAYSR